MRRQLVPGPVVRLTVIKAKTRPGIEATSSSSKMKHLVAAAPDQAYTVVNFGGKNKA